MKCKHCGIALTREEVASNAHVHQVHGIDFDLCALCWDAWGEMMYGWQAGVPAHKRVLYADRAKKWEARQKK